MFIKGSKFPFSLILGPENAKNRSISISHDLLVALSSLTPHFNHNMQVLIAFYTFKDNQTEKGDETATFFISVGGRKGQIWLNCYISRSRRKGQNLDLLKIQGRKRAKKQSLNCYLLSPAE